MQCWSNLAWIHPLAFERDKDLAAFRKKGKHWTQKEKQWLLEKQMELLAEVIPLHRELQQRGQVELTTTPFYHPILPLLWDKRQARRAMPDVLLPKHLDGYAADAREQIRRAVEYHGKLFGQKPRGMWPSEGSVCQGIIPPIAEAGIHWHVAAENEVRYASVNDEREEMIWVEFYQQDGSRKRFTNRLLTERTVDHDDIRILDCVDCHNRATHIYRDPEEVVDLALADGKIPTSLPFVKRTALAALTGSYADRQTAVDGIANSVRGFYQRDLGDERVMQSSYERPVPVFPCKHKPCKDDQSNRSGRFTSVASWRSWSTTAGAMGMPCFRRSRIL